MDPGVWTSVPDSPEPFDVRVYDSAWVLRTMKTVGGLLRVKDGDLQIMVPGGAGDGVEHRLAPIKAGLTAEVVNAGGFMTVADAHKVFSPFSTVSVPIPEDD